MIFCGKRKIIRFVLTCYFPYTINRQTVERQPASPPSATSRLHTAWVPKGTQIGIQQKVKLIFVYKVLKHSWNTYKQRRALKKLEKCTCNSCLLCVLSIYYESPRPPHIKLPSQVACPHIVCELIAWVTIKSLMSLICAKQNYHSWDFTRSMIPSYLPTGFCKGVGIPFYIVEQKYGGIKSVFNVRIDL